MVYIKVDRINASINSFGRLEAKPQKFAIILQHIECHKSFKKSPKNCCII